MKVLKSFNIFQTKYCFSSLPPSLPPSIQIPTIFPCKDCDKSWLRQEEIQLSFLFWEISDENRENHRRKSLDMDYKVIFVFVFSILHVYSYHLMKIIILIIYIWREAIMLVMYINTFISSPILRIAML